MTRLASPDRRLFLWAGIALIGAGGPAWAGSDLTATASATVLQSGPRAGENGSRYFNIQGKGNETHASYGVLDFPIPKGVEAEKVNAMKLTLVQSIPRFAKDGKVKFYLVADTQTAIEPPTDLKFDASSMKGLGEQFPARFALGTGDFKQIKTGSADHFILTLDASGRECLRDQLKDGGKFRLVVVPAEAGVAATYFGAGAAEPDQRPKLNMRLSP